MQPLKPFLKLYVILEELAIHPLDVFLTDFFGVYTSAAEGNLVGRRQPRCHLVAAPRQVISRSGSKAICSKGTP
jgi:hypothetical protein